MVFVTLLLATSTTMADTIYGVKSRADGPSTTPAHLFSFDSSGGGFQDFGAITLGGNQIDVDGLAVSSLGLFGYESLGPDSTLLSIDPVSAVAVSIGTTLFGVEVRGAMFDNQNRLWVIDALGDDLLEVNPNTGAVLNTIGLNEGGNPFDVNSGTDLAFRADGTFLMASFDTFYTLDPTTGAVTSIFTDTLPGSDGATPFTIGLALTGSDPNLLFSFDAQSNDDIFSYDLNAGFSRNTVFNNIIPSFNSGRGDLASMPIPEPTGVASLLLLGFGLAMRRWKR